MDLHGKAFRAEFPLPEACPEGSAHGMLWTHPRVRESGQTRLYNRRSSISLSLSLQLDLQVHITI